MDIQGPGRRWLQGRRIDADAAAAPYDLVLLDWKMPGMDGVDCARQILEQRRWHGRAPRVMMLTAFSRDKVLQS
ncbi:MAG: response regulator, partial [Telluria sp.]